MRAFIAIAVDEALRAALAQAAERLRARGAKARWVAPENLHMTVKFLGDIDDAVAPEVLARTRAEAALTPPLPLEVGGLAPFPSARKPRVVAAVVNPTPEPLARLAEALDGRFEDLGVPAEGRAFRAHFTLARVKGPKDQRAVLGALGQEAAAQPGPLGRLEVDEVILLGSELRPEGPRYTVVGSAPLGASRP